jgi:putative transposase
VLGGRIANTRWLRRRLKEHRLISAEHRWLTFIRNHAQGIVASDFFTVATGRFRILYVLVVMELGRRQILHYAVTAHPTAEWTLQQFCEALPGGHPYRFVIHDRDSIFSRQLDQEVAALGVLRTPVRAPTANSMCERLVGTVRRECLDYLIPMGKAHLKRVLNTWVRHYNQGRVHISRAGSPGRSEAATSYSLHGPHQPSDEKIRGCDTHIGVDSWSITLSHPPTQINDR